MPIETRPTSSSPVVISLSLPWTDDRAAFIRASMLLASKKARLLWDKRTGRTKNKGGRPSVQQHIYLACGEIWQEWGGKFPARNPTQAHLLERAKEHTEKRTGKPISPNTLKKHVKGWMDGNITIYDTPRRQRLKYFDIQRVIVLSECFLINEKIEIMLGHLTEDQRNQPFTFDRLFKMLDARTNALIEDEWAKNPTIKEMKATIKNLRDIASDPEKLQVWKGGAPDMVDAIYHDYQDHRNLPSLPGRRGAAENPKKFGKSTTKK